MCIDAALPPLLEKSDMGVLHVAYCDWDYVSRIFDSSALRSQFCIDLTRFVVCLQTMWLCEINNCLGL